jgi:methionyl-tRNA formyltransferase
MRALVLGYHTMGCLGFEALRRHGFEVVAVFTHRDDPHEEIWWESLAARAAARNVPVHTPENPKAPEFLHLAASYQPDILFSFYYRHMVPVPVLEVPPAGAFNLHGSLLPRYRGRAPVNWVLVNGETETGVSLHRMVAKPDAGDMVDQEAVPIAFEDTARTLFTKLEKAAVVLLDRSLPRILSGTAPSVPLDLSEGSYFGGRKPEDGLVDWAWGAVRIYNLIRAVTHPYPGAFTTAGGKKLFLWWGTPETDIIADAAAGPRRKGRGMLRVSSAPGTVLSVGPEGVFISTGQGALKLLRCQREGGPELDAAVWAASEKIIAGSRLGS